VFQEHVLYVFDQSAYSRARMAMVAEQCPWTIWETNDCYLISSDISSAMAGTFGDRLRAAPPAQFLPLTTATTFDFSDQGDWTGVGYAGFGDAESWGRATSGDALDIKTGLAKNLTGHALDLHFEIKHLVNEGAQPQFPVQVAVNGVTVATWTFSPAELDQPQPRMISIPGELTRSGILQLHFSTLTDAAPAASKPGGKTRPLNLGFLSLDLDDLGAAP
jgi:hypothetical protein